VNGTPVHSWNEVQQQITASTTSVKLTTQRNDVTIPLTKTESAQHVADGLIYYLPPVFDSVNPGDPAATAGIQAVDSVISVDGQPISSWTDMVDTVGKSAGRAVTLVVGRGAATETLRVTPKAVEDVDPATGEPRTVGRIGAAARNPTQRQPVGFGDAVSAGARITLTYAGAVFKILHDIGTGDVSVRQLGGPIAITRASVSAARSGLASLFDLIALLSINVAVLNLLPIPILDGGQILINVLESAKGSPFSMRTREYILRFGLVAIGLLFLIVMYNDTRVWGERLFGWVGRLFG
jgi:regulator of sigma E protease